MQRALVKGGLIAVGAVGGFTVMSNDSKVLAYHPKKVVLPAIKEEHVPSRREQWTKLSQGTKQDPYDVLIIGGGATGTGCALDSATRGLKTALVEREDFAAGTSSRSTKIVHGGVRYLEKAFKSLDYGQLKLVLEALHERKTLLENAPHMAHELPIMTPCYKWWEVPYYWAGMKAYDLLAGTRSLDWSHYVTPTAAREQFPTLCNHRKADHESLKGVIVYSDGQFNDSRLAVTLACSAALAGATVVNHASATRLLKNDDGKVVGATITDEITGRKMDVYSKAVVNAAGPFCDQVRHLEDPNAPTMILPSSGVHITLPDYYSPENVGMIVPKTKDGRVVFMLPWLEQTIAGTTDSKCSVTMRPQPTEAEIQFILDAIADYLTVKVRRSDVKSAWSGIRPLALDPNATDTASVSRDHIITMDPNGLITVTGGKWTTYRLMAEDCIDRVVKETQLATKAGPCITDNVLLLGAHKYQPALFTEVAQNYVVPHRPGAIDTRVAKYLVNSYGDRAGEITRIAEEQKLGKRLVRGYPIIEAEVVYTMRNEYCETAEDFLARRTRLAFLDRLACRQAIPKVVDIMAAERGWTRWRRWNEIKRAQTFLDTFEAPGIQYPAHGY